MINGRARLDPALAARIAKTLGTTTRFWLNLQAAVDAWDADQARALTFLEPVFVLSSTHMRRP